MFRALSIGAFVAMALGLAGLLYERALFATQPVFITVQVAAFLLMIAARMTFGRRSFHAGADPTEGGLVTGGPYAYIRHPIYAAVLYFVWAGVSSHVSVRTITLAALITAGAITRMLCEEQLLVARYPAYLDYMMRVRRVVPFVV